MGNLRNNFILKTDSYKQSHHKLYPRGTEHVYSYFESRGGPFSEIVFFGLHYILREHFEGRLIRPIDVENAKRIVDAHMGPGIFNYDGWMYIARELGGKLPLKIMALPEGTVVAPHTVLMTVENTDPRCGFLTNFVETLLVQAWYPTSVATNSREMLRIIRNYLKKTSDNLDGLPFKLHDFGFRGSTVFEAAGVGGCAHMVNSKGTDTVPALIVAIECYGAEEMPGNSIVATEHSIMCSWTRAEEFEAVKNLLETHPTGIVACVSDTYSIFNACEHYATDLKELIMSRDGTFVPRPDSGYPPEIVVKCLKILWEGYKDEGSMVGPGKAYKLLPQQIRLIQGDGIDHEMLELILRAMFIAGFSADNLAFGSGGGLVQKLDRDTHKMAFKASSFVVNGERRDERKDPVTDPGKRSKIGRFKVVNAQDGDDEKLYTVQEEDLREDHLKTVFRNGEILVFPKFEDIRKRAKLTD